MLPLAASGSAALADASSADDHPVVRYLDSVYPLSAEGKRALAEMPMQLATLKPDEPIVREGDRPTRCCALLEGFACSFKITGEGKRQIIAYHLPGDVPDVQSLHLTVLDNSVATLTAARVGFIQHEAMRELCRRHPEMTDAFWRATLIAGSIFREWVTNVGGRDAYGRLAHLLCEALVRMRAVGLAEDHACKLPLTQGEIADACGITTVHVNRTLQELRGDGLIELKGNTLVALDWHGLKRAGDFDPTYLHLREEMKGAAD